MSRLMNVIRALVLAACVAPLLALASPGSSYRVSLSSLAGTDPAAAAQQLGAEYHGQLETPVDENGTFLITLSAATADLLRRDPRVSRVERQGVAASAALVPHASSTWTLGDGNYEYDGSGNVKAIGSGVFIYDVENRLVSEGTAGTTATRQKYTYDGFGNIRTYKDDDGLTYTVGADPATNRASVASSSALHMSGTYDHSGNMTGRSDDLFRYDALNVLTKSFADGQWRAYVYNVNDERVGTILMTAETGGGETSSEWTIRDAAGQVLRRFAKQGGQYVWQQDYIYRDGKMLASEVTGQVGTLHYHLDHLGSPRLITGNGGVEISRHTYYPFGKEAVTGQPVREDKKFTGHERDPIGLDYMHARFYDYRMGRFLSVDPTWESAGLGKPQSWNRYSYVLNNPINYTDPDGRVCSAAVVDCVLTGGSVAGPVGAGIGVAVGVGAVYGGSKVNWWAVGEWFASGGGSSGEMAAERFAQNMANHMAEQQEQASGETGTIYEVPGEATSSGRPYVGRHNQPEPNKTRRSNDGRDRTKAQVIDTYDANNKQEGRVKEQKAIDDRGGVTNLDNKRNEIAPKKKDPNEEQQQ